MSQIQRRNSRSMPTCSRCGEEYSHRGWLIRGPETATMCNSCEADVCAGAAVLGITLMACAIRDHIQDSWREGDLDYDQV